MNLGNRDFKERAVGPKFWKAIHDRRGARVFGSLLATGRLFCLGLGMLLVGGSAAPAQPGQEARAGVGAASRQQAGGQQARSQEAAGTISGTVVDRTGGMVAGALVKLTGGGEDLLQSQETVSDSQGQFSLGSVAAGTFQLIITADGFTRQTFSGTVHSGESCIVPPIAMMVAAASSEVLVTMSRTELAEAEIKDEEKQRVLGVVPNFYVTYNPAAVPLTRRQKFELAWKTTVDPISFGLTGAVAGIEQETNAFDEYGQGAQGYAKRYGASYANLVTGTFIGSAVLPSLLKQDPRYFYKGRGSVRSRVLYALANAVICKGDNGKWQPNYSSILGGVAAAGISNLYYPAADRNGAALTAENTLVGIGTTAAANLLQEFVIRKLTPHAPNYAPVQP